MKSPYTDRLPPNWTAVWFEIAMPHQIWQVFDETGRHIADQWHERTGVLTTEGHIEYLWYRYGRRNE